MTLSTRSFHRGAVARRVRLLVLGRPHCVCAVLAFFATVLSAEDARAQIACRFFDDFERPTNTTVGNGWVETESGVSEVRIGSDLGNNHCEITTALDNAITQFAIDTSDLVNVTFAYRCYFAMVIKWG